MESVLEGKKRFVEVVIKLREKYRNMNSKQQNVLLEMRKCLEGDIDGHEIIWSDWNEETVKSSNDKCKKGNENGRNEVDHRKEQFHENFNVSENV